MFCTNKLYLDTLEKVIISLHKNSISCLSFTTLSRSEINLNADCELRSPRLSMIWECVRCGMRAKSLWQHIPMTITLQVVIVNLVKLSMPGTVSLLWRNNHQKHERVVFMPLGGSQSSCHYQREGEGRCVEGHGESNSRLGAYWERWSYILHGPLSEWGPRAGTRETVGQARARGESWYTERNKKEIKK